MVVEVVVAAMAEVEVMAAEEATVGDMEVDTIATIGVMVSVDTSRTSTGQVNNSQNSRKTSTSRISAFPPGAIKKSQSSVAQRRSL